LAKSFFGYVWFLKHFVLVRLCFVFASPAFLFVCVFLVVAEIKVSCNNLVNLFASRSFTVGESSVHKMRLTKRAADWWDSAPFSSIFLASGFSCSRSESRPAHQRLTQTVRRFLLNCSKGVGLRREAMKKTEQQGSFLQVVFRVSTGSICQVGQVGSFGGGGFGYLFCFRIRV
jgi:hypothetical protein